jgi:acyl dehydratase
MSERLTYKHLKEHVGKEIGISDWLEITQDRINAFAECTEDRLWIHVDEERARKSPLGTTVAHGFHLLSLLTHFNLQNELFKAKFKMAVNYGLNRVRFINPVKSGSRIRNRAVLKEVTRKGLRRVVILLENTIEIEGEKKPAVVAEVLALIYL